MSQQHPPAEAVAPQVGPPCPCRHDAGQCQRQQPGDYGRQIWLNNRSGPLPRFPGHQDRRTAGPAARVRSRIRPTDFGRRPAASASLDWGAAAHRGRTAVPCRRRPPSRRGGRYTSARLSALSCAGADVRAGRGREGRHRRPDTTGCQHDCGHVTAHAPPQATGAQVGTQPEAGNRVGLEILMWPSRPHRASPAAQRPVSFARTTAQAAQQQRSTAAVEVVLGYGHATGVTPCPAASNPAPAPTASHQ